MLNLQHFWCKNCNERHESKLTMITITSMYFALERFELCTHEEHLELKRNWRKYSKENSIDIHNQLKKEKTEHEKGKVLRMDVINYQLTGRKWLGFKEAVYYFKEIGEESCKLTRITNLYFCLETKNLLETIRKNWNKSRTRLRF